MITVWVIYERPRDYPGLFVVRPQHPHRDAYGDFYVTYGDATTHRTLEEARQVIPPGLVRVPRDPRDDPKIVESWI